HDVFGVSFAEIAETIGREPAACRQLASRARTRIRGARPRFPVPKERGLKIAAAFFEASRGGDMGKLRGLLAEDVAYYADATEIKPIDQIDGDGDGNPDVDAGVALTNRTFRFVAEARFPDGVDETMPGPFSTLLTPGIDPATGENLPGMTPDADDFTTVLGFDAFNPGSNFHEDVSPDGLQNGVVFFPGSTPLYKNGVLVGGLGISGDGVDQDDVVTFSASGEFLPRRNANDDVVRVDEVFVRDVRLPYQKFLRNPRA
ncbi:MAG: heme-binding protein, partial [Pirellulales bacterium]|nr:heme-binding protein [Pirellulales bacterium]